MRRVNVIGFCAAVLGLAVALPTVSWACIPASGPPETAEQFAARQTSFQSSLWTDADTVMIAAVTGSDISGGTLRVTLTPSLIIKGSAALPAAFVVSDQMSNCRPGGMMGAGSIGAGEIYVVYRRGDSDLVVHQDRLLDPTTRDAWDRVRRVSEN